MNDFAHKKNIGVDDCITIQVICGEWEVGEFCSSVVDVARGIVSFAGQQMRLHKTARFYPRRHLRYGLERQYPMELQ